MENQADNNNSSKDKNNNTLHRMQNMQHVNTQKQPEAQPQQPPTRKEVDENIIDLVMRALYNNGDKIELNLKKDILEPLKIPFDDKGIDRTWDVLMNSGFINPVIGFGNEGKMDLNNEGYKLMSQFDGYKKYLEALAQQQNTPNKEENNEQPEKDDAKKEDDATSKK